MTDDVYMDEESLDVDWAVETAMPSLPLEKNDAGEGKVIATDTSGAELAPALAPALAPISDRGRQLATVIGTGRESRPHDGRGDDAGKDRGTTVQAAKTQRKADALSQKRRPPIAMRYGSGSFFLKEMKAKIVRPIIILALPRLGSDGAIHT